jgi:hypothetical protein
MSKAVRKVDILELVAKASDALQQALEPTQELLEQVPDGAFQSKIPEDWGPEEYEAETRKLLKTLAGVVKNKEALDMPGILIFYPLLFLMYFSVLIQEFE